MFLRKWTFGKVAVGLLVAAFLVLGGINVMGLVQGQKAIKEAEARLCTLQIWKFHAALGGGKQSEGCPSDAVTCFIASWGDNDEKF
ncbi:MAG TPA: hypothetical protein VNL73_08455 [Verrucomicrobiae bacterium]|nr:hypothetical protein [Verrucomicrobiae bacterium]